jgi:ATP-binding cassette subfamily D (ALD) long-chain fatty acid import protein
MFLPQRPYLSIGTLRDQVIYPDGEADMREKSKSENDLKRALDMARLGYLPDREGGWDTRKEWKDVLSGGEKQRLAIARLLYHEPHYAFIDEGTSAVSSDVEGLLYETCKEKGISKFPSFQTVSEVGWLVLTTLDSSHHHLDACLA